MLTTLIVIGVLFWLVCSAYSYFRERHKCRSMGFLWTRGKRLAALAVVLLTGPVMLLIDLLALVTADSGPKLRRWLDEEAKW